MLRWEYKVVSLRDRQYTAALNEFGLDGWELVSVISEAVEATSPERSGAIAGEHPQGGCTSTCNHGG